MLCCENKLVALLLLSNLCLAFILPDEAEKSFNVIQEIFGNSLGGSYGTDSPKNENVDDDIKEIIKEMAEEVATGLADETETQKADVAVDTAFKTCEDYRSFGFQCVPYYQCQNGSIITDGEGLIDIRNGFGTLNPVESKCPGVLDVCCKDPDKDDVPVTTATPYTPKCGRHNDAGINVRVQGFKDHEAQFGEWPHMCAVLKVDASVQSTVEYQCGGSLIADGVVLTAGHCVNKLKAYADQIVVRCGEWNTQNETEPLPHQERFVSEIKIHPEYNGRNLHNDFALLFTENKFELSPHIDTVCLPSPGEEFDAASCFATGWGKDRFGDEGIYQVVLKEVNLHVVNDSHCQNKLRDTKLGRRFHLHKSFMCAGGEPGKDTCTGDGGSPLVCPSKFDSNTFVQAGVVAWGIGCGENEIPGVYAAVSEAVCWIDFAMSCYFGRTSGIFSSYWGYSHEVCGVWHQQSIQSLHRLRGAGKILEQYQECDVHWQKAEDEGAEGDVSTLAKLDRVKPEIVTTKSY